MSGRACRSRVLVAVTVLLLAGCASTAGTNGSVRNNVDPFESTNRKIDQFNQAVDAAVLRPAARAYVRYVPEVLQMMTGNFLSNLLDPYIGLNNLLQGKPRAAASDATRFMLNTVFGFLGVGDPASDMGFRKHQEDFGQTLGVWGFATGPYLVLPFFGPSNFRDGVGFGVDSYATLTNLSDSTSVRLAAFTTNTVHNRAALLPTERLLEDALDRYLLIRDGFLQRRRSLVFDGEPPDEDYDLPDYSDDD
jgi:phospholipid-binding lipoprotein MlaA